MLFMSEIFVAVIISIIERLLCRLGSILECVFFKKATKFFNKVSSEIDAKITIAITINITEISSVVEMGIDTSYTELFLFIAEELRSKKLTEEHALKIIQRKIISKNVANIARSIPIVLNENMSPEGLIIALTDIDIITRLKNYKNPELQK